MAEIDPRRLKPAQLLRLLNAAGRGRVSETQLRRHRNVAGYSISDPQSPRTIDLFRYAAWLTLEFAVAKVPLITGETQPAAPGAYEKHRERAARRQREISGSSREIGDLPPIENPERREACRLDYKLFARTYFPQMFHLEWAEPHLIAANQIETIVLDGGLFALAMPRGWGKTSQCIAGVIWSIVYAHRLFAVYICASKPDAENRVSEIKLQLETNELLAADFPEICFPIRALDGIPNRVNGQMHNGVRTRIAWTKNRIVLPTIAGSATSGSLIEARGIEGAIRGMRHTTGDGRVIRPDIVCVDDPQTEESAGSPTQVQKRERVLNSSVLQLAGPTQRIAVFVPCTVIRQGDLSDRILDRTLNPHWQGQRTAALTSLPTDEKAWDEYREKRAEGLRIGDKGKMANAHFDAHREQLYEGAGLVWQDKIIDGDIDPLQSIMHVKLDDELGFWAELMQQPVTDAEETEDKLDIEQLARRIYAPKRGIVPQEMPNLTAFIDPNSKALWWMVCAFAQDASAHIVDYGIWPEQAGHYFTNRDLKRTMARALPGAGRPAQVLHALESLSDHLLDREWMNEGGHALRIRRCLVDSGWGDITTQIFRFCRQSRHAAILMPSKGWTPKAGAKGIDEWEKRPGERMGHHWRELYSKNYASRYVMFDADLWKTSVANRLRVPRGDAGALTFFEQSRERHRLLIDHVLAEKPRLDDKGVSKRVRWEQQKGVDNDLWDDLIGCAVAASMEGINDVGSLVAPVKRKPKKKLQDIYRERFG